MSRAFVKEGDGAELAELQVSPHRNLVTAEGLRQIEGTVERLRTEQSAARAAEPVRAALPDGKVRFGSLVALMDLSRSRTLDGGAAHVSTGRSSRSRGQHPGRGSTRLARRCGRGR